MDYTLCITSCNRYDLLKRTMDSLVLDGVPPKEILISEDGPLPQMTSNLIAPHPDLHWLGETHRKGQIHSADKLMQMVKTPYVLWCEDDWQFSEPAYQWLPRCQQILDSFPEVFTVSLRHNECNGHPFAVNHGYPFAIQQLNWNGFGSFCFNPGLRRTTDYTKMGTYAALAGQISPGCLNERNISEKYREAGYIIADIGRVIVRHIGSGRSRALEAL
jgi:hypothetical protein